MQPKDSVRNVEVLISGVKLSIPEEYILGDALYGAYGPKGLDEANEVLLSLTLEDVGLGGMSQSGVRSDLLVRLFGDGKPDDDHDAVAAWNGEGLYADRIVEGKDGLFRVYSPYAYPKMWHYFRVRPNGTALMKEVWVARCRLGPSAKEAENLANVRCTSSVFSNGLGIEMTYSGYYVARIEEIENVLVGFVSDHTRSNR